MKHQRWLQRNPTQNYFPLPNVVFGLGLSSGEISVYCYLLYRENRTSFQCWPSYKTIGAALKMSRNTVKKYVDQLQQKGLIETEYTEVFTQSGQKRNGNLKYTIRPIQEVVEAFYQRQLEQATLAQARVKAQQKLAAYNRRRRRPG